MFVEDDNHVECMMEALKEPGCPKEQAVETTGENSDEVFKEFRREYKKRFNWIKAGKISPGIFYALSATAKGKRNECVEDKMSFEEFKKWLSES